MAVMQILQKRGVRAPAPEEIEVGEVAINTAAGKLYVKTDAGEVVAVGSGDSGNGTGSAVTISETAPLDPSNGDEWFCSEEGQEALYIFDGEFWFGATVPSLITKEYAIDALTRSGSVILNLTSDDVFSVKTMYDDVSAYSLLKKGPKGGKPSVGTKECTQTSLGSKLIVRKSAESIGRVDWLDAFCTRHGGR